MHLVSTGVNISSKISDEISEIKQRYIMQSKNIQL